MLSIIIPTLNAADSLARTIGALQPPPYAREVVVVDGGSTDSTVAVAESLGARVITSEKGRGQQLAAGAEAAQGDWLFFLHADTVVDDTWGQDVHNFMAAVENSNRAGYFRFRLDDDSPKARRLERLVAWRNRLLALPYGDQGLLISKDFYKTVGGFSRIPLMEDVDMVRKIGKQRLVRLNASLITSARRYQQDGFNLRALRNLSCLTLYLLGVSPGFIARMYN